MDDEKFRAAVVEQLRNIGKNIMGLGVLILLAQLAMCATTMMHR